MHRLCVLYSLGLREAQFLPAPSGDDTQVAEQPVGGLCAGGGADLVTCSDAAVLQVQAMQRGMRCTVLDTAPIARPNSVLFMMPR